MVQSARPAVGVPVDGRSWGVLSISLPRSTRGAVLAVSLLHLGHLRQDRTPRVTPLANPSLVCVWGGGG